MTDRNNLEYRCLHAEACSECFDWYDRDMTLNPGRVNADNAVCPIRGTTCVRYRLKGLIIQGVDMSWVGSLARRVYMRRDR
jgi:hypothetical protein